MTSLNEFRTALMAVAKRSVTIMGACSNEESTKLYLALPMLGALGYDHTNPYEVYPDHVSGLTTAGVQRVDFAVLSDGVPVIAVEVKAAGTDISGARGDLAAYFNAVDTVKLGVATNGTIFAFYVDSDRPNFMDQEPFLTVDLETVARVGLTDDVVESLALMTRDSIEPRALAEAAHVQLVKKRLRSVFVDEASGPSEELCRFALGRIGLRSVRSEAIDRYYAPMVKSAFEESLVLPVVQRLRTETTGEARGTPASLQQVGQRIATSEREVALLGYVRRRLAYLVADEAHYEAIEHVHAIDYVGRLVVYYARESKGRLFDFIASADKTDKYIFPDPIGEIVTNTVSEIDSALKVTFMTRVKELGSVSGGDSISLPLSPELARTA